MDRYKKKRACKKCGERKHNDRHNIMQDRIGRICNNCGYRWWEFPLDNTDQLKSKLDKTVPLRIPEDAL